MNKKEILHQLDLEFDKGMDLMSSVNQEVANRRVTENKWTVAEEFYHIVKANAALGSGLKQGKLFFVGMGKAKGRARTYEEVIQDYQHKLEARNAINPVRVFSSTDPEKLVLEVLLNQWTMTKTKLNERMEDWTESMMDERRLPHPLLGKISVRDMLYFTIFHSQHHLRSMEAKLKLLS